jgi:hypothetical protein
LGKRLASGIVVSEENLRQLLAQVHAHLGQSGSIDPQSRELLRTVMRDIERALGGAGAAPTAPASLESLAVRFEADHPQLAEALRQIIDSLSKAGI